MLKIKKNKLSENKNSLIVLFQVGISLCVWVPNCSGYNFNAMLNSDVISSNINTYLPCPRS